MSERDCECVCVRCDNQRALLSHSRAHPALDSTLQLSMSGGTHRPPLSSAAKIMHVRSKPTGSYAEDRPRDHSLLMPFRKKSDASKRSDQTQDSVLEERRRRRLRLPRSLSTTRNVSLPEKEIRVIRSHTRSIPADPPAARSVSLGVADETWKASTPSEPIFQRQREARPTRMDAAPHQFRLVGEDLSSSSPEPFPSLGSDHQRDRQHSVLARPDADDASSLTSLTDTDSDINEEETVRIRDVHRIREEQDRHHAFMAPRVVPSGRRSRPKDAPRTPKESSTPRHRGTRPTREPSSSARTVKVAGMSAGTEPGLVPTESPTASAAKFHPPRARIAGASPVMAPSSSSSYAPQTPSPGTRWVPMTPPAADPSLSRTPMLASRGKTSATLLPQPASLSHLAPTATSVADQSRSVSSSTMASTGATPVLSSRPSPAQPRSPNSTLTPMEEHMLALSQAPPSASTSTPQKSAQPMSKRALPSTLRSVDEPAPGAPQRSSLSVTPPSPSDKSSTHDTFEDAASVVSVTRPADSRIRSFERERERVATTEQAHREALAEEERRQREDMERERRAMAEREALRREIREQQQEIEERKRRLMEERRVRDAAASRQVEEQRRSESDALHRGRQREEEAVLQRARIDAETSLELERRTLQESQKAAQMHQEMCELKRQREAQRLEAERERIEHHLRLEMERLKLEEARKAEILAAEMERETRARDEMFALERRRALEERERIEAERRAKQEAELQRIQREKELAELARLEEARHERAMREQQERQQRIEREKKALVEREAREQFEREELARMRREEQLRIQKDREERELQLKLHLEQEKQQHARQSAHDDEWAAKDPSRRRQPGSSANSATFVATAAASAASAVLQNTDGRTMDESNSSTKGTALTATTTARPSSQNASFRRSRSVPALTVANMDQRDTEDDSVAHDFQNAEMSIQSVSLSPSLSSSMSSMSSSSPASSSSSSAAPSLSMSDSIMQARMELHHSGQTQRRDSERAQLEERALKRAKREAEDEDRITRSFSRQREEAHDDDTSSVAETERSTVSRASDASQLSLAINRLQIVSRQQPPAIKGILSRMSASASSTLALPPSLPSSSARSSALKRTSSHSNIRTSMLSTPGAEAAAGADSAPPKPTLRFALPEMPPAAHLGSYPELAWLAYICDHHMPRRVVPSPPIRSSLGTWIRHSVASVASLDTSLMHEEWAVRPVGPYRDGGVRFLPGFTVHGLAFGTAPKTPSSCETLWKSVPVVRRLLQELDLHDVRVMYDVNRSIHAIMDRPDVREELLCRFLAPAGYTPWPDVCDPLALSITDCEAFHLYLFAESELPVASHVYLTGAHRLDKRIPRLSRAVARAYSKVLARIRMQPDGVPDVPASWTVEGPGGHHQVTMSSPYVPGYVSTFRAWAPQPTDENADMYGSEIQRLERELFIAGIWRFLQRGDVVVNAANANCYLFNGEVFTSLSTRHDPIGHLPPFINMFLFPITYYDWIVPSTYMPVMYLDILPWRQQLVSSLQLVRDNIDTIGSNGQVYRIAKWVYRARMTIDVPQDSTASGFAESPYDAHFSWNGTVVFEVEGTSEHVYNFLQRCTSPNESPDLSHTFLDSVLNRTNHSVQVPRLPEPQNGLAMLPTYPWRLLRHRSHPGSYLFSPVQS